MKKFTMLKRYMSGFLAAAMVIGLMPADVALAVTGSQVAEDGTYTKTAHVGRTEEDDENEDIWSEYDIKVTLNVADGVFSDITVTPQNGYDEDESKTYFAKAYNKSKGFQTLLTGKTASEDTINEWVTVSGATRTSEAIKAAALEAIHEAEEAEKSSESETEEPETPAGSETEEPETPSESETEESETPSENETEEPEKPAETYVLMNIPYAEFYEADVNNDVKVDAFSSATLNKTRTSSLAGGSYHVNADGSDITGITFPVKVGEGVDLSKYKKITDEDSVEISVTNRGQTSTTTYTGPDALFENESYAYYVLSETPSYYKEAVVDKDGSLSFGKVVGEVEVLTGVEAELLTDSSYGDYQLDLEGLDAIDASTDKVYGVVVSTSEGSDYGMRHLENIWRVTELAWCTGFTDSVHNCPTSYEHYEAMMGQHINKITYYTSKGIYEIAVDNIYVPVKFEGSVSVEDADIDEGKTTVTASGLPEDFDEQYKVEDLKDAEIKAGILTYSKEAEKGKYTLTVTDGKGKYASISTSFILSTKEMPAAYNGNDEEPALVTAEDSSVETFEDYLKNISIVTVNGTDYAAAGRGAVAIINEDGSLNLEAVSGGAAIFAEYGAYEMTVNSVGYPELTFTYTKKEAAVPTEPDDGKDDPVPPTDPSEPDDGKDDSAAPADPSNPGNGDGTTVSGNGNQNIQNSDSVNTGDSNYAYLWMALLMLSLCGGGYVVISKRRKGV